MSTIGKKETIICGPGYVKVAVTLPTLWLSKITDTWKRFLWWRWKRTQQTPPGEATLRIIVYVVFPDGKVRRKEDVLKGKSGAPYTRELEIVNTP